MANISPKGLRPPTKDETPSASPAAVFRFGQVSAAIFADEVKLASGKTATVRNVSLRRSYKNAEGAWQHTHMLHTADLLPAALALVKCADLIAEANGDAE